ncbi:MAG: type II toxin-antitoxin system RelE/ParE family toxin [Chthoniobacterales bacterium]
MRGFAGKSAARFLLRLRDTKLKACFDEVIELFGDDPRPPGCRKLAGTSDRYRVRVEDYRVLSSINDGKVTVLVLMIGHRREVYDG